MDISKKISDVTPHNMDSGNHIDLDKRMDVEHKVTEINPNDHKIDIDRRVPIETERHNELKALSPEQKETFAQKLNYSLEKIGDFKIDEKGILHYDTINHEFEGKIVENGVPYFKKQVEINGVKIEGVFPKFKAEYETMLPPDKMRNTNYTEICNKDLKAVIENDPKLRESFSSKQVQDIEEGKTPDGYVWHHNEEPGRMQLVKQDDHEGARHTGGSFLWGPGAGNYNSSKGVHF